MWRGQSCRRPKSVRRNGEGRRRRRRRFRRRLLVHSSPAGEVQAAAEGQGDEGREGALAGLPGHGSARLRAAACHVVPPARAAAEDLPAGERGQARRADRLRHPPPQRPRRDGRRRHLSPPVRRGKGRSQGLKFGSSLDFSRPRSCNCFFLFSPPPFLAAAFKMERGRRRGIGGLI